MLSSSRRICQRPSPSTCGVDFREDWRSKVVVLVYNEDGPVAFSAPIEAAITALGRLFMVSIKFKGVCLYFNKSYHAMY